MSILTICFCTAISALALATADLSVTVTDTPDPVLANGNITYAIVLTNNGPDAAQNVALSEAVPVSTTFQTISVPAGWTCITPAVGGTGSVNCTRTALSSGTSNTFSLTVKVAASATNGTAVDYGVSVSSTTPDSNGINNSASTRTSVAAPDAADTQLSLTGAPPTALRGSNIIYAFTFRNNGPAGATSVQVGFNIPSNTTFQTISVPAGWTCVTPAVGGTGTVNCTQGSGFAAGTSVNFPLTVKVAAGAANGAVIAENGTSSSVSASPDPNGANNAASATTTVLVPSAASISATGRVMTADGRGVGGARVTVVDANGISRSAVTSPFGFYRFDGLAAGAVYVFSVRDKNYAFAPQTVNLLDAVDNLDFTAAPQ